MDKDRLWFLINQEVDGLNSDEEEKELREELDSCVSSKKLMDEIRQLGRNLDSLERIDHMDGLASSVIRKLRDKERRQRRSWLNFDWVLGRLHSPYILVYPLMAGLLLGLLIGLLWKDRSIKSIRNEDVLGTIGSVSDWRLVTVENLGENQVRLSQAGSSFLIDIDIRVNDPVELEFHYDSDKLTFKKVSCLPSCNLNASAGILSLVSKGAGQKRIVWNLIDYSKSEVEFHLRSNGVVRHSSSWELAIEK